MRPQFMVVQFKMLHKGSSPFGRTTCKLIVFTGKNLFFKAVINTYHFITADMQISSNGKTVN